MKRRNSVGIALPTLAFLALLTPRDAAAETGIAPTAQLSMFFEFGDEAGFSGGIALWAGASIYPALPRSEEGLSLVASPGVEFRTGPIPVLTGPNEISPQLRIGAVVLGPSAVTGDTISAPDGLTFTDLKIQGILGYRWASDFGLDNLDGRRSNESAFRLGIDVTAVGLLRLLFPVPMLNVLTGIVDLNRDGSTDRAGFSVGLGF